MNDYTRDTIKRFFFGKMLKSVKYAYCMLCGNRITKENRLILSISAKTWTDPDYGHLQGRKPGLLGGYTPYLYEDGKPTKSLPEGHVFIGYTCPECSRDGQTAKIAK